MAEARDQYLQQEMSVIGGNQGDEDEADSVNGSEKEDRMHLNLQDPTGNGTGFVDTSIMT